MMQPTRFGIIQEAETNIIENKSFINFSVAVICILHNTFTFFFYISIQIETFIEMHKCI